MPSRLAREAWWWTPWESNSVTFAVQEQTATHRRGPSYISFFYFFFWIEVFSSKTLFLLLWLISTGEQNRWSRHTMYKYRGSNWLSLCFPHTTHGDFDGGPKSFITLTALIWYVKKESNLQPLPCRDKTLPLSYWRIITLSTPKDLHLLVDLELC